MSEIHPPAPRTATVSPNSAGYGTSRDRNRTRFSLVSGGKVCLTITRRILFAKHYIEAGGLPMVTKWYAWSTSIAVVAILATSCDMGKPGGAGTCTTSVSTIISAVGMCYATPSLSPTAMFSSIPASAAPSLAPSPPVSSPSVSVSMPLSTANLLGTPGFVNGSGFTVYVFDADLAQANASSCNVGCSGVWPAVPPPNGTLPSGWTSFKRLDGTMQLAYKGRALYTYVGDPAPGTTNGDGLTAFGGVWHVARP